MALRSKDLKRALRLTEKTSKKKPGRLSRWTSVLTIIISALVLAQYFGYELPVDVFSTTVIVILATLALISGVYMFFQSFKKK